MFRSKLLSIIAAGTLLIQAGNLCAQEVSSPAASAQKSPGSSAAANGPMLRIQLVISRFDGEKKLGSLPYTLIAAPWTPGNSNTAGIRLGVDVPVPAASPAVATEYRTLGMNIDCLNVRELAGGRYQFDINLKSTGAVAAANVGAVAGFPMFRRFDTSFTSILRDGQSTQAVTSTDPVTGEVIKIDVTLNVLH
jgi:hypothetical protein